MIVKGGADGPPLPPSMNDSLFLVRESIYLSESKKREREGAHVDQDRRSRSVGRVRSRRAR